MWEPSPISSESLSLTGDGTHGHQPRGRTRMATPDETAECFLEDESEEEAPDVESRYRDLSLRGDVLQGHPNEPSAFAAAVSAFEELWRARSGGGPVPREQLVEHLSAMVEFSSEMSRLWDDDFRRWELVDDFHRWVYDALTELHGRWAAAADVLEIERPAPAVDWYSQLFDFRVRARRGTAV